MVFHKREAKKAMVLLFVVVPARFAMSIPDTSLICLDLPN